MSGITTHITNYAPTPPTTLNCNCISLSGSKSNVLYMSLQVDVYVKRRPLVHHLRFAIAHASRASIALSEVPILHPIAIAQEIKRILMKLKANCVVD